ncbi:MAG: acyl--CoA ligase, partial [Candidatus Caldatribacterium sp.]|nr:acyl--CoA ligase [Candidatus Caldatribacterium sp.]
MHENHSEKSIAERFLDAAEKHPELTALEYYGRRITYRALSERIRRFASAWQRLGIAPGDRVILCLPNVPEMVISLYSLNLMGAVSCLVHPLSTASEMSFYIQDTESKWLITMDIFYRNFKECVEESAIAKVVLTNPLAELPFSLRLLALFRKRKGHKALPLRNNDFLVSWENLARDLPPPVERAFHYAPCDPALILFTGGTTGTPKGVLLTNGNLNALADQVLSQIRPSPGESVLCILPFFHGFGLGVCLHPALLGGGCCILVPRFSKEEFIKAVAKKKPNYIAGVPTHFEALLSSRKLERLSFSFLKTAVSGGDRVPPSLIHRFNDFMKNHKSNVTLREGYGLTECVSACSVMPENSQKAGSIGLPLPGNRFKIVRPQTTEEVPRGEEGEICVSGPTVMLGYNNRPDETAQVLRQHEDGRLWLHTGDLGFMDEDGYVYFTGRLKRIIKCSGFSVYPSRVEKVIESHPAVL